MTTALFLLIAIILFLYFKNKKKVVTPVVQHTTIKNISNVNQRNLTSPIGR